MASQLENVGSLITYKDEQGRDVALGYLFDFSGYGIYSPNGKVEITKEQADTHNRLLDEAELKGLDENCAVGQWGTFYFNQRKGVTTWVGTVVSPTYTITGNKRLTIYFSRAGKRYRGILRKDADCFNFKRIA